MPRLLFILIAVIGCAAGEPVAAPALTREQAAVLTATLDEAEPEVLAAAAAGSERRRLRKELGALRRALADADPAELARRVRAARRLVSTPPPGLELVLTQAARAAANPPRR